MLKSSKIYVAGHQGLVGSALLRALRSNGYHNIVTKTFSELDLRNRSSIDSFFKANQPEYVFLAAARVGGIQANIDYPAEFIYDNILISSNIIDASYRFDVKKLLFLGSSCIYPKMAPQPIKEESLLTGPLEPSNEYYALAKIAGLKMCEAYNKQYGTKFISCMPTNLYGPNDNFDFKTSHVLPALISKFYRAKCEGLTEVMLWGTGTPKREFLYVDDLAAGIIFLMDHYSEDQTINIGTGIDVSIQELALLVKEVVGFEGKLVFDTSKPDGTPRKLLDISKITALGWKANIDLKNGTKRTYEWFKKYKAESFLWSMQKKEKVSQIDIG